MENRIFFELAVPVFTDITKRRGSRAGELIGIEFELTDEIVKEIDKKSMKFAEEVNNTTRKKLKQELGEGIAAGEGVPKLSERVSGVFKERRKYESERIARTEVNAASNGAELEAYKQSEVIEKKEWLATLDDRTAPVCVALNGNVVGLKRTFNGGFQHPPAHPNCRCAILPVVE